MSGRKRADLAIFMASVQTYEAIQKVDTQTDFFGRASHSVRVCLRLPSSDNRSFRVGVTSLMASKSKTCISVSDHLFGSFHFRFLLTAELSESLQELTVVSIPKCKGVIADEQKHITVRLFLFDNLHFMLQSNRICARRSKNIH